MACLKLALGLWRLAALHLFLNKEMKNQGCLGSVKIKLSLTGVSVLDDFFICFSFKVQTQNLCKVSVARQLKSFISTVINPLRGKGILCHFTMANVRQFDLSKG